MPPSEMVSFVDEDVMARGRGVQTIIVRAA